MRSPIHLELSPCDSTSTTTLVNKTCPVNTSRDHLPHLDHPNISSELTDNSTVGSTEPESILDPEDLFQLDSISISSQATCSIENEFLPEINGQLDDTNLSPTDISLGTMTMKCPYCKRRLMHHMTISIIMALKSKIKMSSSLMPPS